MEELRTLVKERGAETFLAAPLREPTPRDFPDSFEPTVRGVETLLRRILGLRFEPGLVLQPSAQGGRG